MIATFYKRMVCAALAAVVLSAVTVRSQTPLPGVVEMPVPASLPLVAHAERERVYDVLHYTIDIAVDDARHRVSGLTTIRLAPLSDGFRTLELDAADLLVTRVESAGRPLTFASDNERETLTIDLGRDVERNEAIDVAIAYSATPRRGLYFVEGAPGSGTKQFWTQGETNDNHFWFPCWDYPNDKATADVIMTFRGSFTGVSNGALVSSKTNRDGTRTMHWRQSKPNATYLVMIAAGDFVEIRDRWRGRPVTYLVPRSKVRYARRTFGRTPRMMEYFSRVIGIEYPWAKYSQITLGKFFFGGMENTSATTLEDAVFVDSPAETEDTADSLIAHELAHQWFGDLITCRDWSHAWLNEGFATYFDMLWTEHVRGREALRERVRQTVAEHMRSAGARSRPLVHNVYRTPFDLFFDGVIYPKGALVLHMLRFVVGDDAFWRGIRLYAKRHAYGVVTTDDFRAAMEEASGQPLTWFFDEWTRGRGYPEFEVSRTWDAATSMLVVRVRQGTTVFRMPIEIEIATAKGTRIERVTVDAAENVFRFPCASEPSSVLLDPNDWLLKTVEE